MTPDLAETPVHWRHTANPEFPYRAQVDGTEWRLRLNDFPVEPLYTLPINNEPSGDLYDFPTAWTR